MASEYFKGRWLCEECLAKENVKVVAPRAKSMRPGKSEANIVDAEPLGSCLRAWTVRWLAERPSRNDKQYGTKEIGYFMGPINWLSEKSGIGVRRVSGICNGEFTRVPLSQADALLTAIGEADRLSPLTGDIEVKPNPTWSHEQWHSYMRSRGCT